MPKIEASHKDLCALIGRKLSTEQLGEELLFAKGELDEVNEDTLKLDLKDTNRPDMWSSEGVAREIRARQNPVFPKYEIRKGPFVVNVDPSVSKVRPFTMCAVVKGIRFSEHVLSQIIQLQEKVAGTFGRNRKEVAIGVYDLDRIKFPIKYTTVKPEGIKFAPLGSEAKMTPAEILETHQKGKEYAHLLSGNEYPIFIDSAGEVLSLPPIINSNYSGQITNETKDVFIECSGFDMKFLNTALNVLVAALHERGGIIYGVDVKYGSKILTSPDLAPKKFTINPEYVRRITGLNLNEKQLLELLKKSLYEPKLNGKKIDLLYPAYRQDLMHERDVVEDVLISYGFNAIEPEKIKIITKGGSSEKYKLYERVAQIMIGCGFQEIASYTLTNIDNLHKKMLTDGRFVEIENPMSSNWSVFRTSLLPGILEFYSRNMHIEYPQSLFEAGNVILTDPGAETRTRDEFHVAGAVSASTVSYDMISSVFDALMRNLGLQYEMKKAAHPSMIEGRTAEIMVNKKHAGFIGEINPQVLNNWGIEKPVVAFELKMD
jgi:phenylalanyl-tRNA synthetase beta chain